MKVSFFNKQGQKLVGVLQGDGKKGVVILHGFTATKERLNFLADAFAAAGFSVLHFDFSGNGESEGIFEETHYTKATNDALSAIEFMKSKGFGDIAVVGHSFGAAVSLLTASMSDVKCVVSFASTAHPNPEKIARISRELAKRELPAGFLNDVANTDVLSAVRKLKVPVLFIHGDKDDITNVSNAKELYENAREPKKLAVIPGVNHFFEKSRLAVEEAVAWLRKYL